jgi:hypothetical protein
LSKNSSKLVQVFSHFILFSICARVGNFFISILPFAAKFLIAFQLNNCSPLSSDGNQSRYSRTKASFCAPSIFFLSTITFFSIRLSNGFLGEGLAKYAVASSLVTPFFVSQTLRDFFSSSDKPKSIL